MNGAYLIYQEIDEKRASGIEKKIILQKRAFENIGIKMDYVLLEDKNGSCWHEPSRLYKYDFIYFRKQTVIEWQFISFFRSIRKNNPLVVIIMDIPTWPYDGEFGNTIRGETTLLIDKVFRQRIKGIIDRVVLTGINDTVFFGNVPTLTVINGIDFGSIPTRMHEQMPGVIRIGCVGRLSPWHGYERIIKGLSEYYKTERKVEVYIYIVGDGPEEEYYRQLVCELQLSEKVKFCGFQTGSNLESYYNQIDFGCCSLGRYKSNTDIIGDLKSRDYLSRGIPIISGCKIDILLNRKFDYNIEYPNDSSLIDIERIVNFYNETVKDRQEIVEKEIQEFAKPLIDFNCTYKVVQDAVLELYRQKQLYHQ